MLSGITENDHQVLEYCDRRIKEDIQDINDDTTLPMILVIEPKTHRYICIDTIRMVKVNGSRYPWTDSPLCLMRFLGYTFIWKFFYEQQIKGEVKGIHLLFIMKR